MLKEIQMLFLELLALCLCEVFVPRFEFSHEPVVLDWVLIGELCVPR